MAIHISVIERAYHADRAGGSGQISVDFLPPGKILTPAMRRALWLNVLFLLFATGACDDEKQAREEERARNLAILTNLASAEQTGGSAKIAFRNEYNPGSCSAWLVNINKNGATKSVISATETGQTSATVNVPAPDLYDLDIRCANGSGNVNLPGQGVENGRSYLLHYKSDANISFAEFSL